MFFSLRKSQESLEVAESLQIYFDGKIKIDIYEVLIFVSSHTKTFSAIAEVGQKNLRIYDKERVKEDFDIPFNLIETIYNI